MSLRTRTVRTWPTPDWTTILSPFASTGELWWADRGITLAGSKASAWKGAVHGYALSQSTDANRPTVGASSKFAGKTALSFTLANATLLANAALTALIKSTDTQPYIALLLSADSIVSNAAAVQSVLAGYDASGVTPAEVVYWTGGAGGLHMHTTGGGIYEPQGNDTITEGAAMLIEAWTDASGFQQYARNYNVATAASVSSPSFNGVDVTQLGIGANLISGSPADFTIRGLAVLPSKPPDVTRRALFKFCQHDSGI